MVIAKCLKIKNEYVHVQLFLYDYNVISLPTALSYTSC